MRRYLLMILTGIVVLSGSAYAARCFRPVQIPACAAPAAITEPKCLWYTTSGVQP